MTERPFMPTEEALERLVGDLAGLRVADLGAGTGGLARRLAARGARVTAVEPNPEAARRAAEAGDIRIVQAPAEHTGLPAGTFDLALFSMSLHHAEDMEAALAEACRILRPGGVLAVAEPVAPDPIWPVMRWIDDESAVYAEAQAAIEALVASGRATLSGHMDYAGRYRVETPEAMIEDMVFVDSGRSIDVEGRARLATAFHAAQQRDPEGGFIPYWLRLDTFTVAGTVAG